MAHYKGTDIWTRWARVEPVWRSEQDREVRLAFQALQEILPAPEYDKMVLEWKMGTREIRIENGFIVTCLTPEQEP